MEKGPMKFTSDVSLPTDDKIAMRGEQTTAWPLTGLKTQVLSWEPHPKCKPKATDNCIKRTLHKLNNPCTRKYKHCCFLPGGNSTTPRLMFLSLKLVIRGLNPQSSITLLLGVPIHH